MSTPIQKCRVDELGRITAEAGDQVLLLGPDDRPVAGVNCLWTPSAVTAQHLPEGFTFGMRRVVLPDGLRRFYPVSFGGQIALGFLGGLALLAVLESLTPRQRHSYRAMYQFFERIRVTREHLGNALLSASSLSVSRVVRDTANVRNILPATLGLDARGRGSPWGVDRLLREGLEEAHAAGLKRPDEADCIHHGLVAAARRYPLYLQEEDVPRLVRTALYDTISCEVPRDSSLLDQVVERSLAAIHGHLVDPAEAFRDWFSGAKNSFVWQIARRKLLPGGILSREPVRRVLLELGWEAYGYVADCIDTMMRVFLRSLPELLSPTEETVYEHMHLRQPYLGNLPLVLMLERFPLLRSLLWEIWSNPSDRELIAILHRLLDYYGDMALARRDADRKFKQRRPHTPAVGEKTPLTVPLPSGILATGEDETGNDIGDQGIPDSDEHITAACTRDGADAEIFARLAELVRERRRIHCQCAVPAWDDRVVAQGEAEVTIAHACTVCGATAESTLCLQELRQMAHEVKR